MKKSEEKKLLREVEESLTGKGKLLCPITSSLKRDPTTGKDRWIVDYCAKELCGVYSIKRKCCGFIS